MTRSVFRHVLHKITEHPDSEITYEAACIWCDWQATPSADSAEVDLACLTHTGASTHKSFRRTRTSLAIVTRADDGRPDAG
ncbi:hypothetical protein [Streptomyces sp. NPDC060194]|uniref:DUF7848 domain-containing protein n=1 Tax=Streptomyces sp. NPDC060194 TaxID=3347069 RepID=UPI00365FA4A4